MSFSSGHPKISVVIPAFNRGYCLSEAVKSVYDQTITDFELIIIDDGSTDGTKDLFASPPDNLRYYYQVNQGVSSARNHGIRMAKGRYLAFLDSDDLWKSNHLQTHIEFLEKNQEYGMSFNYAEIIDFDTRRSNGKYSRYLSDDIYPDLLFISKNHITTPSVVVRATVFDAVGIFDEALDICEDLDLWRRIARKYKVKCIPEFLTVVRTREHQFEAEKYFRKRKHFLELAIADDPELDQVVIANLFMELYCVYFNAGCPLGVIFSDLESTQNQYPSLKAMLHEQAGRVLDQVLTSDQKKMQLIINDSIIKIDGNIFTNIRKFIRKKLSGLN